MKVSMEMKFDVPKDAKYTKEKGANKKFKELDHPKAFYDLEESEQNVLLDWCSGLKKVGSINMNHTSYRLKHIFENSENGFYIKNGQLKGAMILAGFDVKNTKMLNWNFNVSEMSINYEIRNLNFYK